MGPLCENKFCAPVESYLLNLQQARAPDPVMQKISKAFARIRRALRSCEVRAKELRMAGKQKPTRARCPAEFYYEGVLVRLADFFHMLAFERTQFTANRLQHRTVEGNLGFGHNIMLPPKR